MKFFLASDIEFVYDEFLQWSGALQGQRIAWIQNGCDVYDNPYRIESKRDFFVAQGAELISVDLRMVSGDSLTILLNGCNGIYVTGGNIFYLLDLVRRSGFDKSLEQLKSSELWYAGSSAGTALLGKSIKHCDILDDATKGLHLESTDALGYINRCFIPHRGLKKFEERFQSILELKNLPAPLLVMEDHHYITI